VYVEAGRVEMIVDAGRVAVFVKVTLSVSISIETESIVVGIFFVVV